MAADMEASMFIMFTTCLTCMCVHVCVCVHICVCVHAWDTPHTHTHDPLPIHPSATPPGGCTPRITEKFDNT